MLAQALHLDSTDDWMFVYLFIPPCEALWARKVWFNLLLPFLLLNSFGTVGKESHSSRKSFPSGRPWFLGTSSSNSNSFEGFTFFSKYGPPVIDFRSENLLNIGHFDCWKWGTHWFSLKVRFSLGWKASRICLESHVTVTYSRSAHWALQWYRYTRFFGHWMEHRDWSEIVLMFNCFSVYPIFDCSWRTSSQRHWF